MDNLLFSGNAYIEMQGEAVLDFLQISADHAVYKIIGFDNPSIFVHDYRLSGIMAIEKVLLNKQNDQFVEDFNTRANVRIYSDKERNYLIELHESNDTSPTHVLWITIGFGDWYPAYDYHLYEISPLDDSTNAFFAIYRRPSALKEYSYESDVGSAALLGYK